ncbi:hypothetical protein EDE08_11740 [Bradyrhizobium sp. R2.2-H]|jgi:hypothetical protein|nr:hypothetical protein EDE10_117106 [Bradyrhizobium sp. Y-H1]TCU65857.1 hypothetical protein EDE08_11740 [Bradyrhizobium sp. R2.2-H]
MNRFWSPNHQITGCRMENLANWLYLIGSLCFVVGTVINMRPT